MLTYQAMREGRLPAGRQLQCPKCGGESAAQRWNALRMVCPLCGYHRPVGAYTRLWQILPQAGFRKIVKPMNYYQTDNYAAQSLDAKVVQS